MAQPSTDFILVSDAAELENSSISELITYLTTEFRSESYKKVEKILISNEEKLKSEIRRLSGLEQRYEILLTRVTKLEETTSAWSSLASQISENGDSKLDAGTGSSEKKRMKCEIKEENSQRETNGGIHDFGGIQSVCHTPNEGRGGGRVEDNSGTSEKKGMKCETEEEKTQRGINGVARDFAGIQSVCHKPDQERGSGGVEGSICHAPDQGRGAGRVEGNSGSSEKNGLKCGTKEGKSQRGTNGVVHDIAGIQSVCHTPDRGRGGVTVEGPRVRTPLCKPLNKEELERFSTPKSGIEKSTSEIVIEINDSDSDNESEAMPKEKFPSDVATRTHPSPKKEKNKSSSVEKFSSASTLKRKRSLKIVDSDSEDNNNGSDIESKVQKFPNKVGMKTCSSQNGDETQRSCERKRALKITSSDSEEDDSRANKEATGPPKNDLSKLLLGIRNWKARGSKWQYEIDMISSFESDPLLCMKAVCTLYRRGLFDKKVDGGSSKLNNRRFSLSMEERGATIAKFLLDGNEEGEMKKSIKDMEMYDPKGLEECERLAKHYSNELFSIYQKQEDSFFP